MCHNYADLITKCSCDHISYGACAFSGSNKCKNLRDNDPRIVGIGRRRRQKMHWQRRAFQLAIWMRLNSTKPLRHEALAGMRALGHADDAEHVNPDGGGLFDLLKGVPVSVDAAEYRNGTICFVRFDPVERTRVAVIEQSHV